ncbi:uracil-DNA glycosylase family protein [Stakelama tenebrarum]|uniref:Uracil-DNA glycosylase n=1 Tax=Stakelama tenebrarum TaxID=2711215 RepID=A0A6G6Y5W5_9SPHN|nr:uracil-DNA glycosylase family protein [Sphingosinithalassobacter tenebrarum]QIG80344.1 uracil-DNA glycosylase [Sphingosinithalassobacter tenebrarum]
MGAEPTESWQAVAASVLEWWHEAGVDTLMQDNARDWLARLAEPAAVATMSHAEAAAPLSAPTETLPETLDAFIAWRMGESAPEASWIGSRFVPEGNSDAPLMVVTDMPESDGLMGGAPGRLFDRMLTAIGRTRADIYLTSLAWAPPVARQLPADFETRLADLTRHHIGLVAPKQLLLVGRTTERLLFATDAEDAEDGLGYVNHFRGKIEAVACLHPRHLLDHPGRKALAWKNLQMLLIRGNSL